MTPPAPLAEGVSFRPPPVDPLGRLRKTRMRFGGSRRLGEFAGEFAFFTPAPLYLLGVVSDAPLVDFLVEHRLAADFYFAVFDRPVFSGLVAPDGDRMWDHGLWALRADVWPLFADFYCSLAIRDGESGRLWRVGMQWLDVADPLTVDRAVVLPPVLPTVRVAAFGVNGSGYRAAFKPPAAPGLGLPALAMYGPDGEVGAFAAGLAAGVNPYDAQAAYARLVKEKIRG